MLFRSVLQDKTYWITCFWDKTNLLATLKVYDPATWLLVGTRTNVLLSRDAENIIIGRYDEHGSALENASAYFDDLIWDETGSTYPLFPTSRPVDLPKIVTFDDLSPGADWTLIPGGYEDLQ